MMKEYPIDDYGMVLTKEQVKILAKEFIDEDIWEEEDWESANVWEYAEAIESDVMIWKHSDFIGEAYVVMEDGHCDYGADALEDDDLFYISLDQSVSPFKVAYESLDEAKEEIAKRIHYVFPVEIHRVSGVYYG